MRTQVSEAITSTGCAAPFRGSTSCIRRRHRESNGGFVKINAQSRGSRAETRVADSDIASVSSHSSTSRCGIQQSSGFRKDVLVVPRKIKPSTVGKRVTMEGVERYKSTTNLSLTSPRSTEVSVTNEQSTRLSTTMHQDAHHSSPGKSMMKRSRKHHSHRTRAPVSILKNKSFDGEVDQSPPRSPHSPAHAALSLVGEQPISARELGRGETHASRSENPDRLEGDADSVPGLDPVASINSENSINLEDSSRRNDQNFVRRLQDSEPSSPSRSSILKRPGEGGSVTLREGENISWRMRSVVERRVVIDVSDRPIFNVNSHFNEAHIEERLERVQSEVREGSLPPSPCKSSILKRVSDGCASSVLQDGFNVLRKVKTSPERRVECLERFTSGSSSALSCVLSRDGALSDQDSLPSSPCKSSILKRVNESCSPSVLQNGFNVFRKGANDQTSKNCNLSLQDSQPSSPSKSSILKRANDGCSYSMLQDGFNVLRKVKTSPEKRSECLGRFTSGSYSSLNSMHSVEVSLGSDQNSKHSNLPLQNSQPSSPSKSSILKRPNEGCSSSTLQDGFNVMRRVKSSPEKRVTMECPERITSGSSSTLSSETLKHSNFPLQDSQPSSPNKSSILKRPSEGCSSSLQDGFNVLRRVKSSPEKRVTMECPERFTSGSSSSLTSLHSIEMSSLSDQNSKHSNQSLQDSQPSSPSKSSILKRSNEGGSRDSSLQRCTAPVSILKNKSTPEEQGPLHSSPPVTFSMDRRHGILKKRSSLDENEILRRRSRSPDVSQTTFQEFRPILKNQRRSSLDEIVRRTRSPDSHPPSILKRRSSSKDEEKDERQQSSLSEPQSILKRKSSGGSSIGGHHATSASSSGPEDSTDPSEVRPILKKKSTREENVPSEARPILKKKSSTDSEEHEDRPKRTILKCTLRSSQDDSTSESSCLASPKKLTFLGNRSCQFGSILRQALGVHGYVTLGDEDFEIPMDPREGILRKRAQSVGHVRVANFGGEVLDRRSCESASLDDVRQGKRQVEDTLKPILKQPGGEGEEVTQKRGNFLDDAMIRRRGHFLDGPVEDLGGDSSGCLRQMTLRKRAQSAGHIKIGKFREEFLERRSLNDVRKEQPSNTGSSRSSILRSEKKDSEPQEVQSDISEYPGTIQETLKRSDEDFGERRVSFEVSESPKRLPTRRPFLQGDHQGGHQDVLQGTLQGVLQDPSHGELRVIGSLDEEIDFSRLSLADRRFSRNGSLDRLRSTRSRVSERSCKMQVGSSGDPEVCHKVSRLNASSSRRSSPDS
ncbi:serine/arginine repetitive matrix protein 2 isoform X2 [Orussus abietinus]|nr:serine/arginine repetitive matrix protein 2 isoform X2 [Orussus abietinus]XP_012273508.1 serine/arginine repetitive matrix protein 2 isoform X2 [Orussus abietinus]